MPRRKPRGALRAYRGSLHVLVWGVALQFYLFGLLFYGVSELHRVLGWLLLLPAASAMVAGLFLQRRRLGGIAAVLVLLVALQPIFVFTLAAVSPYLAALHPLNGLAIVVISWGLLTETRDRRQEGV